MNDDLKNRILLFMAIFLTFLLLIEWQRSTVRPPEPEDGPPVIENEAPPREPAGPEVAGDAGDTGDAGLTSPAAEAEAVYDEIVLMRPESALVFSSRGGALKHYRLRNYTLSTQTPDEELVLVDALAPGRLSLALDRLGGNEDPLEDPAFRTRNYRLVSLPADAMVPGEDGALETRRTDDPALVFETVVDGWRIRKTFRFPEEDPFGLRLEIAFTNTAEADRALGYGIVGPAGILPDDPSQTWGLLEGLSAAPAGQSATEVDVTRTPLRSIWSGGEPILDKQAIAWAGLKNRFFTAILTVEEPRGILLSVLRNVRVENEAILGDPALRPLLVPRTISIRTASGRSEKAVLNSECALRTRKATVPGGATVIHAYGFYGGPAADDQLAAFDPRLPKLVYYAWSVVDPLSRLFIRILNWIEAVIGNYGVAIILLTLLIRSAMHPLTRKALASGDKMRKIQPILAELKKKYATDKAKLHQETMRIHREYGISLWGGCLPMLLQLPIFFSLYGAFARGFSGRQADFVAWIDDLSQPDRMFVWEGRLPFLEWNSLNLLPILYIAITTVQMSLQPKSDDPQMAQQQKMMKLFPIFFGFIVYNMPSGLVLYFTVSGLYTLVEHWIIKRQIAAAEADGSFAIPGAAGEKPPAAPEKAAAGQGIGPQGKKKKRKKK